MSSTNNMTKLQFALFLILLTSVSPVPSMATVDVNYYYQSLFKYCATYFQTTLAELFQNGLIDSINLNLVPWGNAKILPNGTFDCQNGPDECYLNTVEACAIEIWPQVKTHFDFINCVETLVAQEEDYENKWKECFDKVNLDGKEVLECADGDRGKEIERRYAQITPPHEYVPWVTVEGKPLLTDILNLKSYICKAIGDSEKPAACDKSFVAGLNEKEKMNFVNPGEPRQYLQAQEYM